MILPWLSLFFHSFFCQLNSYDNQLLLPPALMLPVFVKSSSDFFLSNIPDKHLLFEKTFSFQTFSIYSNTWRDHITSTRYMSKIPGSINKTIVLVAKRTKIKFISFHENYSYIVVFIARYNQINILTYLLFFEEIPSYLKMHPHSSCQIIFFFGENYENIE